MSIYKRDDVLPEWEPIPWCDKGPDADEQEIGFNQRALKPLVWTKIDWKNYPEDGIFGHDRHWFSNNEITYVTTFDDEDMVLIDHFWYGFPDPPRWGLASRPAGNAGVSWKMWGHFPDLPTAWLVPDAV